MAKVAVQPSRLRAPPRRQLENKRATSRPNLVSPHEGLQAAPSTVDSAAVRLPYALALGSLGMLVESAEGERADVLGIDIGNRPQDAHDVRVAVFDKQFEV